MASQVASLGTAELKGQELQAHGRAAAGGMPTENRDTHPPPSDRDMDETRKAMEASEEIGHVNCLERNGDVGAQVAETLGGTRHYRYGDVSTEQDFPSMTEIGSPSTSPTTGGGHGFMKLFTQGASSVSKTAALYSPSLPASSATGGGPELSTPTTLHAVPPSPAIQQQQPKKKFSLLSTSLNSPALTDAAFSGIPESPWPQEMASFTCNPEEAGAHSSSILDKPSKLFSAPDFNPVDPSSPSIHQQDSPMVGFVTSGNFADTPTISSSAVPSNGPFSSPQQESSSLASHKDLVPPASMVLAQSPSSRNLPTKPPSSPLVGPHTSPSSKESPSSPSSDSIKRLSRSKSDKEVLIGTPVKEGHVNYTLMYDMLTGIRVSVSRCQAKMPRPLQDKDFRAAHKLAFDMCVFFHKVSGGLEG
jgi:hypothetical protein